MSNKFSFSIKKIDLIYILQNKSEKKGQKLLKNEDFFIDLI